MSPSLGPVLLVFTAMLSAAGGGCASEDQVTEADFVGTYRPTSGGAIDAIVFSENKDYLLMPSGCASQGCAEIGRFQFDAASKQLALTAVKTGATRYLPVEVMETSGAAKTKGSLVSTKTQQLTNGGGQQLTNGNGQQLTNGNGEKLAEAGQKLLESIVKALIDMQSMQQQNGQNGGGQNGGGQNGGGQNGEEKPFDLTCQQGVPTPMSTPADVAAYWQRCPQGVVTRQK
ncbi:MAG: hypothetical protein JST00_09320 [Deltaproteobacteria bacterium]|nr:hypothetical protein [Deltaproteobacteria bacterium]